MRAVRQVAQAATSDSHTTFFIPWPHAAATPPQEFQLHVFEDGVENMQHAFVREDLLSQDQRQRQLVACCPVASKSPDTEAEHLRESAAGTQDPDELGDERCTLAQLCDGVIKPILQRC